MGPTTPKYKHTVLWTNCISKHTNPSTFCRESLLTMKEMVMWIFQYQYTEIFFTVWDAFLLMKRANNNRNPPVCFVTSTSVSLSSQMYLKTMGLWWKASSRTLGHASGLPNWDSFSGSWMLQSHYLLAWVLTSLGGILSPPLTTPLWLIWTCVLAFWLSFLASEII